MVTRSPTSGKRYLAALVAALAISSAVALTGVASAQRSGSHCPESARVDCPPVDGDPFMPDTVEGR